ncbi:GTP-binding protein, partial [Acinetobacter baumannii]
QAGAMARHGLAGYWWAAVAEEDWPSDLASIEEIKKNWDARTGDARQELVLIGMQMDEQALIQRLDSCLLNDEEMALGPQAWQSWSNPFKQDDETMLIA